MRLEFFYDTVSPYSYLAFEALCRYRDRWDLDLVLRPAFLGGVMKATGNAPPASLPARGVYMLRDLARLSRYFKVPMSFPEDFPTNTIAAMRLLTIVAADHPDKHEATARALWRRYWGEGKDLTREVGLGVACDEASVPRTALQRLDDEDVKAALRRATDEAVARGAFGFPAMFVTDQDGEEQMFFGSDRLSLLAHELSLPWLGPAP